MGAIYGGVFPIYAFFSMGKVVSHLPLFSYIGAVSFLNFHFEKIFNIVYLFTMPPIAKNISKASSGKYSDEHPELQTSYWKLQVVTYEFSRVN